MTDPTARNRLDEEASPYLRQHADNPVHWQPWDEAAFEAARERDVPVFVSVGYSACHWCHVMAEESFEDEEVAAVLNERFVPVKVDREERPDVDSLYMTVCQLVRGGGGWPLSVFCTPEGEPFYVGTYFPRDARPGQPGFLQLLRDVADSWAEDRESVEERAREWTRAATEELESVPDPDGGPDWDPGAGDGDDLLADAAEAAVSRADRDNGGFGGSPKFPHPGWCDLLFRADYFGAGDGPYREVAVEALDAMAGGGLYDHVGGGFHRYCTDADWTVPHFEKMLYDNAELPRAFLAGYRVTGEERYARVARETFEFLDRELSHPEGGFYSTLDARSGGEEGAFYTWTPEQVREAVASEADPGDEGEVEAADDLLADLFCERFGVTEAGNFEGATVLTASRSLADLAAGRDLSEAGVEYHLRTAERRAFAARAERARPARDEKVLAGWNGLAASALAEGALSLAPAWGERAADAVAFAREHLWDGDRLRRRYKDGDVKGDGFLEDYAFLARGALDAYGVTGDVSHLAFALDLAGVVVEEFYDPDDETLFFTPAGGEALLARPQELSDHSTPSSTGVAVDVLGALDGFAAHDRFSEVADAVATTHAPRFRESPLEHAALLSAADARRRGHLEVTVVPEVLPEEWRADLGGAYLPDRVLAPRPAGDGALAGWLDELGLDAAPPAWAGRGDGEGPTLYVCRRACSPPLSDVASAVEWAADLR
ncbi:MAG: thioredoxin domain-containing protein [Halobacteriaceae archaeon]